MNVIDKIRKADLQTIKYLLWNSNAYSMYVAILGLIAALTLALAVYLGHPRGEVMVYMSLFAYVSAFGMHLIGVYKTYKSIKQYDETEVFDDLPW